MRRIMRERIDHGCIEEDPGEHHIMAWQLGIDPLDHIRSIPSFEEKKEDLPSFIKQIELIVRRVTDYNPPSQRLILNSIKNRITGEARQIIHIHCHLTTWDEIKELLVNEFFSFKPT